MKLSQISWLWLLLGLVGLILVGLAALPRLLVDSSRLAERVSATLAAWTGGEVKLTGPLQVQYFPDVAVRSGFELTNAPRLPLVKSIAASDARISLDLAALFRGRIRVDSVRLTSPKITLKEAPSLVTGPDQTLQARIANLLQGAPLRVLRVRGGTIRMPTASGGEAIEKLDAKFELSSGTGATSSSASFVLRDEPVSLALETGAPSETADGTRVPLTLSFAAAPVTAAVTGNASFTNGFALDGDVLADMANARAFLRWVGIPTVEGESLKGLSARGRAHWNGTTLTFDDGSFTVDGNAAVGALAVTPGKRPRIDGTLDFDRLALDPYIGASSPAEPALRAALLDQPVIGSLDTDLRISAADITAPSFKLGRGAVTINSREGLVSSEVGGLEFCGGQAAGRIDVDLSQAVTKVKLAGKLSDIPVEDCLGPIALHVPFRGGGTLKADFATEGRDYDELVRELSGPFKVKARNGTVSVDFARLFAGPSAIEGAGWSSDGMTAFENLYGECRLGDGHIWCEKFNMQTEHGLISGSGDVNLRQQTLDWRLFVANGAAPFKASQLNVENPPQISISGALTQPTIRRAERPIPREGFVTPNTKATQVSPR
jgi:AsmA protein